MDINLYFQLKDDLYKVVTLYYNNMILFRENKEIAKAYMKIALAWSDMQGLGVSLGFLNPDTNERIG